MKGIGLTVTITMICAACIGGTWAAGLSDMSGQLKILQPDTIYKITDIAGNKLPVSDPTGTKSTLSGVDTSGLKVGGVLKGAALQQKLGVSPKASIPDSVPKPGWK